MMKLVFFFLLLGSNWVWAGQTYAQKTPLNLDLRNVKLEEVFDHIRRQSEFEFFYNNDQVNTSVKVSVKAENANINTVLDQALPDIYEYTIKDRYVLIHKRKEVTPAQQQQQPQQQQQQQTKKTVTGKITDKNGESIIGASIIEKGTGNGTVTDMEGNFTLRVEQNAILHISYMGYLAQDINTTDKTIFNIILEEEIKALEEMVVVGYGSMKKRDISGSIATISNESLRNTPVKNVMSALQGRASGVQVVSNSGAPGDGISVTVRGQSTLNSGNEPLYVIDGVPVESNSLSQLNGYDSHGLNPLADLNPQDIESIEILKDGSSTAIYGSRAANGVVLITTKRGKEGKPQINVNLYTGVSNITRKLSVLNATQWRDIIIDAYKNLDAYNNAANPSEPHWTVVDSLNPMNNGDVDWQDVMYRTAYQKQASISVIGGNQAARYSLSSSFLNQDGIILNSNYKRITSRLNTDFKITEKVSAGYSVSYTHGKNNRINAGGTGNHSLVQSILVRPPVYSLTYPDGSPIYYFNGKRNPVGVAVEATHLNTTNRIIGNQYVEWEILKDLRFKTNVSIDFITMKEDEFYPSTIDYRAGWNTGAVRAIHNLTWANENFLTYNKSFLDHHHISLLGGFSQQEWKTETTGLDGQFFASDNIRTLNGAGTISGQSVNTTVEHSLMSVFGRVGYDYLGKYLLQATMRADGSSRFGKEKKWGTFPSASVAWRFSDEPLFEKLNALEDGKLRFSVGQTGNESIGNYISQGEFSLNANYLDYSGASPTAMPNKNLSWETTTQYNAGIDLSLFNGRIFLTADAYQKNTTDLLFNVPIPETTGFSSISQNIGEIRNRGLEFALTTHNLTGQFSWTTSFNLGMNRNKIISLPENILTNGFIQNGTYHILKVGEPIGTFYGWKFLGVYSRDEDNTKQVKYGSANGKVFRGGDPIWDDLNGDNIIDDQDKQMIGNAQPLFTGGLNNDFSYKNFTLNFFLQFSYGNDIYSNLNMMRNWVFAYNNVSTDALHRWRKQGDITDYPRPIRNDPLGNEYLRVSDRWIEDGSYMRLKNVSLAYDLPRNLANKIFLEGLQLYVTGENLITWTHYTAYDPDVSSFSGLRIGVDDGSYPQSRTFVFGLNIKF